MFVCEDRRNLRKCVYDRSEWMHSRPSDREREWEKIKLPFLGICGNSFYWSHHCVCMPLCSLFSLWTCFMFMLTNVCAICVFWCMCVVHVCEWESSYAFSMLLFLLPDSVSSFVYDIRRLSTYIGKWASFLLFFFVATDNNF